MCAKILQKETFITLVTSGEEDYVAGGQRWEGDFSIYILLQLQSFELSEYITHSNCIFKLFFETQLALYTVTLISWQTEYLACRRHFQNQFCQAYQCDYQCWDSRFVYFVVFQGFLYSMGFFWGGIWFILQCAFIGSRVF